MTTAQCIEVLRNRQLNVCAGCDCDFYNALSYALTILENLNEEKIIDIIAYQESYYDIIHLTLKPRQSKREFVAQALIEGLTQ